MKRRLLNSLLAAAGAVAPLALAASPAQAQSVVRPANDITLSIGRGQLVSTSGRMADVFVADEKIADVQIKSDRQLYVFGKAGGTTTIYASNASGDIVWSANVKVGSNIDSVDQMLTLAMPESQVNVATIGNNTMLLTGTVASPEDAAEAQRLVAAYVGGAGGAANVNVISRLRMATPLQVNLQVRIAEVSRSLVKTMGSNLSTIDGSSGIKFGIGQGRAFSPQQTGQLYGTAPLIIGTTGSANTSIVTPIGSSASTLAFAGKAFGVDLLGALDAGETAGMVTTLAQPNLTALSGETADFLAGGEFPIAVSQGLGSVSIEYKKYGISLAYTPTVLANGRISLRVRPEVSELSSQGSIQMNGFNVPALTVRRAETTVELGSGQSFMIAGLLKNGTQNQVNKLPGGGDIPILGTLFRSTSFQRGETELVIVVTPYLVNPVNAADIKLPTDGYQSPNDIQRIFGGYEHDGRKAETMKPSAAETAPANPAVSALDPNKMLVEQARAEEARTTAERGDRKERRHKRTAATAAPAPGFSLN